MKINLNHLLYCKTKILENTSSWKVKLHWKWYVRVYLCSVGLCVLDFCNPAGYIGFPNPNLEFNFQSKQQLNFGNLAIFHNESSFLPRIVEIKN